MKIETTKWNGKHIMEINEKDRGQITIDGVYCDNAMQPKRYCESVRNHIKNGTFTNFLHEQMHDFLKGAINTINWNEKYIARDGGVANSVGTFYNSLSCIKHCDKICEAHTRFINDEYKIIEN